MGQKIETLKGLVTNAERSGRLPRDLANAFWNVVGGRPAEAAPAAPQDREVTIRLRVGGRADAGAYGARINDEVERALSALARQAGVTVTRGSVNVAGL